MKASKRILALLLVVAVIAAFGATAFAEGNGVITVKGEDVFRKDDIYNLYRVFDATVSGSGSDTHAAYTMTAKWKPFFIGNNAPGMDYISATEVTDAPIVDVDGTAYWLKITQANVPEFAQAALSWAASNATLVDATHQVTKAEETAGEFSFTGLDLGYYLVYPQGATDVLNAYASIASLTTTVPDATVNVKAKLPGRPGPGPDDPPPFDKNAVDPQTGNSIKHIDVNVGDSVTFKITGAVPDTTGYSTYKYIVTDTMSDGLTFGGVSGVIVKFGNTTISPESGKYSRSLVGNGFKLEFDMTQYQNYKGEDITITYSAVVNANALQGNAATNTATLDYSNNPQTPTDTVPFNPDPNNPDDPDPTVDVTTNTITVNKVEGGSNNKLNGAKFVLQNSNNEYYKETRASNGTLTKVEWVAQLSQATELETKNGGVAAFEGIEDGTYKLTETVAPGGYNKLAGPIENIKVEAAKNSSGDWVGKNLPLDVENNIGSVLPGTGGIGTTIFYVLGSCLLIGAAVLMITRKRMGREG